MAVIPYLYRRMVALGIPHSQAELFADQDAEIGIPSEADALPAIEQIDPEGEIGEAAVNKINELIVAMQAAGMMEED